MVEVIYADDQKDLIIRGRRDPSRDVVDLLAGTVWGSGETRYMIHDAEAKLRLLAGSELITMELDGSLIGFYALRRKRVRLGEFEANAYYRTYLALAPEYRGRGYGALLAAQAKRYLVSILESLGAPGLIYGYVEEDNLASLKTVEGVGYESIAVLRSTIFSRWRPRFDARCRLLNPSELHTMTSLLERLYESHCLRDFDQSVAPASYWVLESDGHIAAGLQIETCHWRVLNLPGVSGALLVHGVSRLPVLRRLFDARHCRFLKFANLYVSPGQETLFFPLMESILALNELNAAMILHDPRSDVFQRVVSSGSFGILNTGIDPRVHVMASAVNFTKEQNQSLRRMPLTVSPLDIG